MTKEGLQGINMLVSCRGHSKIIISYIEKLNSGLGKMSWTSWSEVKKSMPNYNCKNCVRDGGGARSIKKYLLNMIHYIVRLALCELLEGHCNWWANLTRQLNNMLCEVYIEWCKKGGSISLVLIFCKICEGGR